MLQQTIDIERLRNDLREAARQAGLLKAMLRTRWSRAMADEQRALAELRRRTTRLCILRAFVRGRYHLEKPPREGAYPGMTWDRAAYHSRVAERTAREYGVVASTVSVGQSEQP